MHCNNMHTKLQIQKPLLMWSHTSQLHAVPTHGYFEDRCEGIFIYIAIPNQGEAVILH